MKAEIEKALTDKILSRLAVMFTEYKNAGFNQSAQTVRLVMSEIEILTSNESKMIDGHFCDAFCEICKKHIED